MDEGGGWTLNDNSHIINEFQHAGIYTLLGLLDDNDVISNYYDSGAESSFDSIDEANWPESEESIQDSDSTEGREIKKVSLLVADVF